MAESARLLVGTRKGIWIFTANDARGTWAAEGPMFLGHIAQHVVLDPRDGTTLLAAMRTGHLGPTVFRSRDFGTSWSEASRPPAFSEGDPKRRSLNAAFWLTPGHAQQPHTWYLGGSPQGLFRSDDDGDTWEPCNGWN